MLAREREAWHELQTALAPKVRMFARHHENLRLNDVAEDPDTLQEVVAATFKRLSHEDFANLRKFQERAPSDDSAFAERLDSWVCGAVDFAALDHLRDLNGRKSKKAPNEYERREPTRRDLHQRAVPLEDAEDFPALMRTIGMTTRLTVAQIFAHIEASFTAEEMQAMQLHYTGAKYEELAEALQLKDADSAKLLIRRLVERLRYKFLKQD